MNDGIRGTTWYGESREAEARRKDREQHRVSNAMRRVMPVRSPGGVVFGYVVRSKRPGRACPFFTSEAEAMTFALSERMNRHG